ncbi:MAG: DUF971 domain-containing protein [Chloroflexota bacterium]
MTTLTPTGVKADKTERVVQISWSDGTTCSLSFAGLRAICPCVECRGGHSQMGKPPDLDVLHNTKNESLTLDEVTAVGSYAIQFMWSDGHYTGIYTWEFLKQACEK